MSRQGTLSKAERDTIVIRKFIFHILHKNQAAPTLLSQVVLTPAQTEFFKQRIAESAEGTQYKFIDRTHTTAAAIQSMVTNPNQQFLSSSELLAGDFNTRHMNTTNSGAFVVALFNVTVANINVEMVALLKMDQIKVFGYKLDQQGGNTTATLTEILDTFVESKAAVQKSAIIEIGNTYLWDVLAQERAKSDGIADYFKGFLNVQEADTPSALTRKAVDAVSRWAKTNQAVLPEAPYEYRLRAVQYLENHNAFDTAGFLDMVVYDADPARKQSTIASLSTELYTVGIGGQQFSPSPNSIPDRQKSTRLKTREGVLISWGGSRSSANIEITTDPVTGTHTITIETDSFLENQ